MLTKQQVVNGLKAFVNPVPKRDLSVSRRRAAYGALAVVATQLTDFTSTYIGITFSGAREGNGLMAEVLHTYGWTGFLAVKLLGAAFLAWFTYRRKYAPWVLSGFYTLVTIWNLALALALQTL